MNPIVDEPLLKRHDPFSQRFEYLQDLIEGQARILEMISKGGDLKDILNAIVNWAEAESAEGLVASILLTNYNGKQLLHGSAPSLPEDYNNAIHGIEIGPNVGSCGTAAYTKKQVIVEDIATDPLWANFKNLAMGYGLRACWSTPLITNEGTVIGTFAMYYRQPKKPSAHDLQIIKLISYTAVIAIEWIRSAVEKKTLLENEQKRIEKIKDESQSFYNMLMNAPAMVAVLKGPEHVFELANPVYMEAVGSERKVLGKPLREALPEVVEQGFLDLLNNVYNTQTPYFGNEVRIKLDRRGKAELEDAYFNFIYQPIKNASGESEGIFVHAVNITEQVKARMRAEESEQRFRSFVLNSPMPIGIYVGREMRIQTANDAVLKAWEKDRSVVGKTFREALPELEGQPFYDILDNVYTSGIPYQASEERVDLLRNNKLTPTYWNFDYTPLKNESGEIYGVMNTATEVTELVTAKKNLLAAEEALRSALEIGGLGTWSIDLSNNTVTYDEAVLYWFGLPENGASLVDVIDRINPEYQQIVATAVQQAIDTQSFYEAEYKVTNPLNGRERTLYAKGKVLLDENGKITHLNGICRDISLQRETEKELTRKVEQRTLELRNANAELNVLNDNLKQFVYVASHDLQEPLRKINLFSDLLQQRSDKLDPEDHIYLSKISKAATRMSSLIRNLLDLSRAESNDRSFAKVDLNKVVRNVIEDYELLIKQKAAEVKVEELPVLTAIPLQMNQLFYNLLGNALKFSKEDGKTVISIHSRYLSQNEVAQYDQLQSSQVYIEITISDNGIGFEQKFAEQIFVIFQRLHVRNEYEGTGIGLALCKKIVENHNGVITAEGKKNEGAIFRIVLPAQ